MTWPSESSRRKQNIARLAAGKVLRFWIFSRDWIEKHDRRSHQTKQVKLENEKAVFLALSTCGSVTERNVENCVSIAGWNPLHTHSHPRRIDPKLPSKSRVSWIKSSAESEAFVSGDNWTARVHWTGGIDFLVVRDFASELYAIRPRAQWRDHKLHNFLLLIGVFVNSIGWP